jgi:hypothetical protein
LRPTAKPDASKDSKNGVRRGASASDERVLKYPITGIADCCARTANGHVAAVQPKSVINSRRLIGLPKGMEEASYRPKLVA